MKKAYTMRDLWGLVNRIQLGQNRDEILERCEKAKAFIGRVHLSGMINNAQYNDLMRSVSFLYREAYGM